MTMGSSSNRRMKCRELLSKRILIDVVPRRVVIAKVVCVADVEDTFFMEGMWSFHTS